MPGPLTLVTSSATPSPIVGWRPVNNISFGVWEFPGDTMRPLTAPSPPPRTVPALVGTRNVTDKYISTNQYGYNVDLISFNTGGVPLNAGTYWLNLHNATVPSGDPVYWDENSGTGCGGSGCPSSASESAVGTIPSEAFTIGARQAPREARLSPAASCCSVLESWVLPAYCVANCSKAKRTILP